MEGNWYKCMTVTCIMSLETVETKENFLHFNWLCSTNNFLRKKYILGGYKKTTATSFWFLQGKISVSEMLERCDSVSKWHFCAAKKKQVLGLEKKGKHRCVRILWDVVSCSGKCGFLWGWNGTKLCLHLAAEEGLAPLPTYTVKGLRKGLPGG